jgi:BCD family chlorophyll transporter-like MFS transporter
MGLWGAAQAIAYGAGGVAATVLVDLGRGLGATPLAAYACVFGLEAALFLFAAGLARFNAQRQPLEGSAVTRRPAMSA